ncbi:angiotensin-converting enzyme-like [Uloborus diversus]|uniref:angiotensin-converting enzyme-like n=1 Tax=Uloborus diversus TaxID=327109 RepID=UPI0024090FCC|nr:angiotensin-converting enzyme-like [Uloborus diversus]
MSQDFYNFVVIFATVNLLSILGTSHTTVSITDEIHEASKRLQDFNDEYETMWWLHQSADWNYSTNVSSVTSAAREFISEVYSDWMRNWKLWARDTDSYFLPSEIQRQINIMASGVVIMNSNDARVVTNLKSKLIRIYSSAEISIKEKNVTAKGETEFSSLMASIREPKMLKNIWTSWRMQTGEKAKILLLKLLKVANKASQENGYSDVGAAWREELGMMSVIDTTLKLWIEVKGFYQELHAYVRHKLKLLYGDKEFNDNNLIPAHLLGSIWGENWVALSDVLMPYPEYSLDNITEKFIAENFSVYDIAHKAQSIYTTMGFAEMDENFWRKSMFLKPDDGRLVDCHAVSYDFGLYEDYRVRMCGEVTEKSFLEMVHEMGHIQYYIAYHDQPMIYRSGANSAFHEAVGETMVYAAESPKCLKSLKLTETSEYSKKMLLNTLMKQALSKFVILPWALTLEIWRYLMFSGYIVEENMTEIWWKLRRSFQGLEPPDEEASKLFDAGSKYHVINNIPYMRYFLCRFLEHHFLEALCKLSDENVHSCCFINSKPAAEKFWKMMSLGASVTWQEALETLTGHSNLSPSPLIEYYKPLHLWLTEYNEKYNIAVSW